MRGKREKKKRVEGGQGPEIIYIKTKRTKGGADVAVRYDTVIDLLYDDHFSSFACYGMSGLIVILDRFNANYVHIFREKVRKNFVAVDV